MYNYFNNIQKHKVFISYYHKDDQKYKNYIDDNFKDIIINKSVMDNDIDSDNSDEYIKRLIREDYIFLLPVGRRQDAGGGLTAGPPAFTGNGGIVL